MKVITLRTIMGWVWLIGGTAGLLSLFVERSNSSVECIMEIVLPILFVVTGLTILLVHEKPCPVCESKRTPFEDLPQDVRYALADLNADVSVIMGARSHPEGYTNPEHTINKRLVEMNHVLNELFSGEKLGD